MTCHHGGPEDAAALSAALVLGPILATYLPLLARRVLRAARPFLDRATTKECTCPTPPKPCS